MLITDSHLSALQEITNAATEQASGNLARLLEIFVTLSEPHIAIMDPSDISMALSAIDTNADSYAICQSFIGGGVAGEAMLLFNKPCFEELSSIMHYEEYLDRDSKRELLMDTANLLFGTCIKGFAKQIDLTFSFSPPKVLDKPQDNAEFIEIQNRTQPAWQTWKETLVVKIRSQFEDKDIHCDLLIFFTEDSVSTLMSKLNYLIDG